MTEILMKNNFVYDDEDKSWGRGNWTIRFYKNMVEIFNTPDVEGGKYYCSNIYLKKQKSESFL